MTDLHDPKRGALIVLSEEMIARFLRLPEGWQVLGVRDNFEANAVLVRVTGPDAPTYAPGTYPVRLDVEVDWSGGTFRVIYPPRARATDCASTLPRFKPSGWRCTGENLLQVGIMKHEGRELPIVIPAGHEHEVVGLPGPYTPYDNSGDHIHLTLSPVVGRAELRSLIATLDDGLSGERPLDEVAAELRDRLTELELNGITHEPVRVPLRTPVADAEDSPTG